MVEPCTPSPFDDPHPSFPEREPPPEDFPTPSLLSSSRITIGRCEPPRTFHLNRKEHPTIRFEWGNGIMNTYEDSFESALLLSNLIDSYNIYGLYNPTHGSTILDRARYCYEKLGHTTPPITLIIEEWQNYFAASPPENIIIRVCHSEGVVQTRNALNLIPPALRSRIHVIAISPPVCIPSSLCAGIYHLCSTHDPVSWSAIREAKKLSEHHTFQIIPRHSEARIIDHGFCSPTFHAPIATLLRTYLVGCS